MIDGPSKTLLPDGLRDVLPPEATREARVMRGLIDRFRASAYRRVDPPLVEFEDSLLAGAGVATAKHTFRLMDPVSQRMMGVRADMTTQVARIASARLGKAPRPLRLCYAGPVLRVRGSQLSPERQVTQAGCELIGADVPEADAELIILAADALNGVDVQGLSIDIGLPTLVPIVLDALALSDDAKALAVQALDRKDAHQISSLGGKAAEVLGGLMGATGLADDALDTLQALSLPMEAADQVARLSTVLNLVRAAMPHLILTVDPVENRGFEYHAGLSFTVFARDVRGELGRGGRYDAGSGESGMGVTLYLDTVLRAVPPDAATITVFLPYGTPAQTGTALRGDGWTTLAGLAEVANPAAEAVRLGCTHIWNDETGAVIALLNA